MHKKNAEGISSVHIGFRKYENPIEIIITFFRGGDKHTP
jgi:hypothetical protein